MSWIFFSILASLIWAGVNIVDKYVMSKLVDKPIIPMIILGIIGLPVSAAVYLFHGFASLSWFNIFLALVAALFYIFMCLFYFKAIQHEEISRIVPLFYLNSFFVIFLASTFLGEIFEPFKYVGVVLLVAGAILISMKKSLDLHFNPPFYFMLLASFCSAVAQVITKYLLNYADYWTIFAYLRIWTFIALIPIYFLYFPDLIQAVKKGGKKVIFVISLNELISLGALVLTTIATSIGYITLVNALSAIQPFFVLALSVIISIFFPAILAEELDKATISRKVVAIAMMFAGVIWIS